MDGTPEGGADAAPDLSLAIPFYNEEPNVRPVLADLSAALAARGLRFELIAVDNGSRDGTAAEIASFLIDHSEVLLVRVPQNRGYGHGILTGLARARGRVVGYAWGDGQVSAEDLVRIYDALIEQGTDLAKAQRVRREDGRFRLCQSLAYRAVFALLFGWRCPDPNGCPKLFLAEAYARIAPRSKDWLLDPEIMVKSHRMGMKAANVPVVFKKRRRGRSKVSLKTTVSFLAGLLRMRLFGV
jgi:dolichol-phosphate mannosyltransferase